MIELREVLASKKLTIPNVDYETLSSEYYDNVRHPTCADFRYASLHLISSYLSLASLGTAPRVLEVGAGRSVFVDLASRFPHLLGGLVVTDRSPGMLRHSGGALNGARFVRAEAQRLPFHDDDFDIVIASLGDPYNTEEFWREARRVLAKDGRCIFTTPAASWSDNYRTDEQAGRQNIAVFVTVAGTAVGVPSYVMKPAAQIEFVERIGLTVTDMSTFTRDMYPESAPSSPKILHFTTPATPVVCQYVARK